MRESGIDDMHPLDVTVINDNEFFVADGFTRSYGFCDAKNNPYGRMISVPVFYILKANEGHPVRLCSSDYNHFSVGPENESDWKNEDGVMKMPAKIYADKMLYNMCAFFLIPYDFKPGIIADTLTFPVGKYFVPTLDKENQPVSLLYTPQNDIVTNIHKYCVVSPSQVVNHFFYWLTSMHRIFSRKGDKPLADEGLEGVIDVSFKRGKEIDFSVSRLLEERFESRLCFER